MFFGCASARNLWRKSLIKYGRRPEINHRILDGIYTETKSLAKIIDKNALFLRVLPWARETIGLSARFCLCIKIFRRILTENAQQYVALLEGFIGDRIGDARNLKQNLENNL